MATPTTTRRTAGTANASGRQTSAPAITITKNSKNEELLAAFAEQMESGKPFIYAQMKGSKDKDKLGDAYEVFYIVQKRELEPDGSSGSNVDDITLLLNGWAPLTRYMRTIRKVNLKQLEIPEIAEVWQVGKPLDNMKVFIREYTEPQYDGHNPKVLITDESEEYFIHTNQQGEIFFVYEQMELKSLTIKGKVNPDAVDMKLGNVKRYSVAEVEEEIANGALENIFGNEE